MTPEINGVIAALGASAHIDRLRIVSLGLMIPLIENRKPHREDLRHILNLDQSTFDTHLKALIEAGLVSWNRKNDTLFFGDMKRPLSVQMALIKWLQHVVFMRNDQQNIFREDYINYWRDDVVRFFSDRWDEKVKSTKG